ncbi:hypothetical protein [Devriesea agamarum]|uniref:hypothetical protein n=1 Tax=Devriesea agamarum TaxID=472569 RepID=UPI00071E5DB2|nr:hypothetical protein [Devriesea agamarum]
MLPLALVSARSVHPPSATLKAMQAAEGMGRDVFEEALQRAGVRYEANVASTGRVSGYRFSISQDAQGKPV